MEKEFCKRHCENIRPYSPGTWACVICGKQFLPVDEVRQRVKHLVDALLAAWSKPKKNDNGAGNGS